jgi:hypothetical protein
MGIIRDDFEPDLPPTNPHKSNLAYPVHLGALRSGPLPPPSCDKSLEVDIYECGELVIHLNNTRDRTYKVDIYEYG